MELNNRLLNAKLNIFISCLCQGISIICGFIVPRLLIGTFGSELYGTTTSVTQFIAYIALIEGGIGGVARAALYRPLAEKDIITISKIVMEVKRLFQIIGAVFFIYAICLAIFFKDIADVQSLDRISTALLVLAISASTCMEYFIGISYQLLLQAAQKTYIINIFSAVTVILNMLFTIILISIGANIIIVKFVSGVIFILKPISINLYVKHTFGLKRVHDQRKYLTQKWTGIGQHIAYFLHSNTDIVILTLFTNLKLVAVYSIYNMIIGQMQKIALSFTAGMEAVFGDMLSKSEFNLLKKTFNCYELLISIVSVALYSSTAILIIPFVTLYMTNVSDANYIQPVFACLLIIATLLYCLRQPYHKMIIAAGHFKQTKIAAYGEAVINIMLSIILVNEYSLIGVAIGTLMAVLFRYVFYIYYVNELILYSKVYHSVKRMIINFVNVSILFYIGFNLIRCVSISNFTDWIIIAIVTASSCTGITVLINRLFYKEDFYNLIDFLRIKGRKK